MNKIGLIFIIVCCIFSCDHNNTQEDEDLYLSIGSFAITQKEYNSFINNLPHNADTNNMTQLWVQQRITQHALINKFEGSLDVEEIEAQLAAYQRDLSLSMIEDMMMLQADEEVVIPDTAIANYYNQNLDFFKATGPLYKIIFIKLNKASNLKSKIEKLLSSPKEKNLEKLRTKYKYEVDQFLEVDEWIDVEKMTKELGVNQSVSLANNKTTVVSEYDYDYFFFVKDVYDKEYLPLSTVIDPIKEILRREEKLEIVRREKLKIYEKFIKKNK